MSDFFESFANSIKDTRLSDNPSEVRERLQLLEQSLEIRQKEILSSNNPCEIISLEDEQVEAVYDDIQKTYRIDTISQVASSPITQGRNRIINATIDDTNSPKIIINNSQIRLTIILNNFQDLKNLLNSLFIKFWR
ncbi:hypothetical protein SAMD00079811_03100 [Scytonema sp. HK-05]|uniref:hypothetical protein n=1 Tax=Scytonema sp. HK-05 TaxID=1137095 RepID=UPI0009363565|nr:hypothetical protein [Scytonema sp. HK-05]OKH60041.1 hypothetical protein NIES2130_06190 [Scytonema sp. HK-05]BAY42732.1 hypothetical protein SAMD00079811_03100 [Scytonema sp. HK-05]